MDWNRILSATGLVLRGFSDTQIINHWLVLPDEDAFAEVVAYATSSDTEDVDRLDASLLGLAATNYAPETRSRLIKFYAIFKIAEMSRYQEFRGFPPGYERSGGSPQAARQTTQIPIAVYLADGSQHARVEAALELVLAALNIEVSEIGDPEVGSWLRRMFGHIEPAAPTLEEVVEKAVRAVELNRLLLPQAGIDAAQGDALAKLITALASEENAVIQIGSMLLVKTGGILAARNLTQLELAHLEKNPALIRDPCTVIHELQAAGSLESRPSSTG